MTATSITGRPPTWRMPLSYRLREWRYRFFPRDSDSNIVMFAKHEMSLIRGPEPDEMQDAIEKHILTMCRAFSREGHSGSSAPYAIGILQKVLRFEPLTPLTGADDEWNEVGEGRYQNRRCGHVFKEGDGPAYDSNGRVFVEPDGSAYTGSGSRVPVTFPYTPTIEYVKVDADGKPLEAAL